MARPNNVGLQRTRNQSQIRPAFTVDRAGQVDIVTRLGDGRCGVRIPAGARDLSLFQNVQSISGANPSSNRGTGVLSWE